MNEYFVSSTNSYFWNQYYRVRVIRKQELIKSLYIALKEAIEFDCDVFEVQHNIVMTTWVNPWKERRWHLDYM